MTASRDTENSTTPATKHRKTVVGEVVSDKMEKTIAVRFVRLERHRRYHKYVRRNTTYKTHDERGEAHVGDVVRIEETRPLSKTKRWRLVDIVRRSQGPGAATFGAEDATPAAGDSEEGGAS